MLHRTVMLIAALLGMTSFAAFFFLIDYASRLLRPINILTIRRRCRARSHRKRISVFLSPSFLIVPRGEGPPAGFTEPYHSAAKGHRAFILAVNLKLLMAEAERSNGVIKFAPQVGDFVAVDEPLFNRGWRRQRD